MARAYDKFLFPENLAGIVPPNASESDSLLLIKNYIDNWIHQQVVLHKAEIILMKEKKTLKSSWMSTVIH